MGQGPSSSWARLEDEGEQSDTYFWGLLQELRLHPGEGW